MTGTNSANDRLILRQNVEINSNEYFSYHIFFREWNRRPSGLKTSLRNHQEKCLSSELFQRFIMVYRTIIGVNFHLFIICYDWWCHFPFLKKSFRHNGSAFWGDVPWCSGASLVAWKVNTNLEAQKLRLRQHRPFMSIKSFEQTQQVWQVTR